LVILAAGAGKRMKSALPKPLHPVAGVPMIERVLRAGRAVQPVSRTVVVSPALVPLPTTGESTDKITIAVQDPPLGTGDAVRTGLSMIGEAEWVVVLYADTPLLTGPTLSRLVAEARRTKALVTMLTCLVSDAAGYGRIERDELGRPCRIAERVDDDPTKRIGITEINSGMMVIRLPWAAQALAALQPSSVSGEYYLTDLVVRAVDEAVTGESAAQWPVATVLAELSEVQGVNDRVELAQAESVARERIRTRHMLNGVTLNAPETVFIDDDVVIGQDTTILPFTILQGTTRIGSHCLIGPQSTLTDAVLGDHVTVRASTVTTTTIGDHSDVGPYAHLRSGTTLGTHVHIGNYAELKNAVLDDRVKSGHVSYLGDVHIGSRTNIGAGTITCNYDGTAKHHTEIGSDVFVGSDSMLIAPLSIGSGAVTGAGSVVTKDVAEGVTVVGIPARPIKRRTIATAEPTQIDQTVRTNDTR